MFEKLLNLGRIGSVCASGKIFSSAHRWIVHLSEFPALNKKVRVAFARCRRTTKRRRHPNSELCLGEND